MPGGSWLASQGRLPLSFMGVGLVWFGIAAAFTAAMPQLLATAHIAPSVVMLTHVWVLGFFVTIAVGATYQLAPVALGTTLRSETLAWFHLLLHGAGVPMMIFGFWRWQLGVVAIGGAAVAAGVLLYAVNTCLTVARSGKRDAVAWSLVLASLWLTATVLAGLALATNRLWNFWPTDPLPLLRAHAHMGLVGFFATLLQGVTFRLVPMFTLGSVPNWRPVRIGLWCSQIGLLVLTPALAWHRGWISFAAAALILIGLASSGYALRLTLATRKKRQLDHGVRAFAFGGVALVCAAAAGLWLLAPSTRAGSMPGGMSANVYGVWLIGGGLLPAIAGMLNKIVPFLTWMRAYGPKVGRMPTPPATSLSHPHLERLALLGIGAAIVLFTIGAWTTVDLWLDVGGAVLGLSVTTYLFNMARILKHLRWPQTLVAKRP